MDPTTATRDPLQGADDFLRALLGQLQSAEDSAERQIVESLHGLVDHVRRVMLPDATDHYRAEKTGYLITAALEAHSAALLAYAQTTAADSADDELIAAATSHAQAVIGALRSLMASAARGSRPWRTQVRRLGDALASASSWADRLRGIAVEDPED